MKNRAKYAYILLLLAASALYWFDTRLVPPSAAHPQELQPGQQAESDSFEPTSSSHLAQPTTGLLDQNGRTFDFVALRGKVLVLNFIFTRCPSVCPEQTQALARVFQQLDSHDQARTQLVSVTIDPEHDSPAELLSFAKEQHVPLEHWSFVSGRKEDIERVNHDFSSQALPPGAQALDHRTEVRLIAHDGRVVQTYRGSPLDEARLAREVHMLVQLTRPSTTSISSKP